MVVGVLFLSATVSFAIGNSLIRSYFSNATSSGGTLLIGALLLGCSALADVAIGFAMRRVLMPHAPLRSQAYFVLRLAECLVVIAVGAYFLASRDNWNAYALAVYVPSGLAGLVLSSALLTSRLVPRGLSLLGIVGYAALLLGVVCDLLGVADLTTSAGFAFLVPGGLFELMLPVRLILRGFDRDPPFRLDMGGNEPAPDTTTAGVVPPTPAPAPS